MNMISNIPFEIYATSKDSPESSLFNNKYINDSFNLNKNISQLK